MGKPTHFWGFIFLTFASFTPTGTSAECSRAALKEAITEYIKASTAGNPSLWTALTSNASYTENGEPVNITKGILSQALKIDHSRRFHDATACASLTELIVTDPIKPYVIHTRMLFDTNNATTKVHTVEALVTILGDWAFNATGYLHWNSLENWDPIPVSKRDDREVIKAAGDAYFDRWNDTSVEIPLGTPCARLEGGAYTGLGDLESNTCNLGGFPSTIVVKNRRYVVDEEMGVVSIFMEFPGLDRTVPDRAAPDSHIFRVQGGRVRYIHTVSHCFAYRCGMTGPVPGSGAD
ncbi:hypothetical protein B0H66DRAFT_609887 [Apodospora peruviana]|uniref:DUF8021 domain-containing protein n=1 Tax=Apodospora peruviana TaxID=516989 RepID=A0AAE0ME83_9PEZI|nr:hypothetical protein B0H66DRAFT_609887 [Apodospora peruviana]